MKLIQQMPGGSNIKAFTRIMHRTADDDLVGEVSTAAAVAAAAGVAAAGLGGMKVGMPACNSAEKGVADIARLKKYSGGKHRLVPVCLL
jgi:hypothetical protein